MRILYVHSTPVPPATDPGTDRYVLLSDRVEGDVLHPLWFSTPEEVVNHFGPDSFPVMKKGRFTYHWILAWRFTGLTRRFSTFYAYIAKGREIYREKPYDCIVTYSHMATALCGVVLKLFTGARLVVEVVCEPSRACLRERRRPRIFDWIRTIYSDICLHITGLMADSIHLLYPAQMDRYPLLRHVPKFSFHEFVPTGAIERHIDDETDKYILLVGAPWYRKGADLLIHAFSRLAADFPDVSLRILGHFPDGAPLEALAATCPRVEIMKARPNHETLPIISGATIFVLPSREEGMGRVLLEAMAAAVPLVGSDTGGIPSLVRDGENGLVFPEEDVAALEDRLRRLLSDPELRRRLGQRGYELAHSEFSTQAYTDHFCRMIRGAIGAHPE